MNGTCIMSQMREDRAPVKWNKRFVYPKSQRSLIQGKRHYDIEHTKLPSVTTIIGATQSEEKRASLAKWKARLGAQAADRVRDVAAMRGTAMHTFLDAYIRGTGHRDLSGIILMCSKDGLFQKFEVADKEFVHYQHAFIKKVDEYYRNCNQNKNQKDTKKDQISEEISH